MRPPGIAMQLDELEYFLPGLYPGVALAIEGKLPFRGLEERWIGYTILDRKTREEGRLRERT